MPHSTCNWRLLVLLIPALLFSSTTCGDIAFRVRDGRGNVAEVHSIGFVQVGSMPKHDFMYAIKGNTTVKLEPAMIRQMSYSTSTRKSTVDFMSGDTVLFDRMETAHRSHRLRLVGHEIVAGQRASFRIDLYGIDNSGFREMVRIEEAAPSTPATPPIPEVQIVSAILAKALGLPKGVEGVLLLTEVGGLEAGVVVESVFHRAVQTEDDFAAAWRNAQDGGQVLLGTWARTEGGEWVRQHQFVWISGDRDPNRQSDAPGIDHEKLEPADIEAMETIRAWRESVQTASRSVRSRAALEGWDPARVEAELTRTRDQVTQTFDSERVRAAREVALRIYTEHLPIAEQIILRTVDKSIGSREELLFDAAAATLSGGGTIGPTLGLTVYDATLEVLVEEGLITDEEARLSRATTTLIRGLNGVSDAKTALDVIAAGRVALEGIVEIVPEDVQNSIPQLRLAISADDRILDLVILLSDEASRTEQSPADADRELQPGTNITRVEVESVVHNPSNGHYYEFVSAQLTWHEAEAAAKRRVFRGVPGHLVTITSAHEQRFVTTQVKFAGVKAWAGGFQESGSREPAAGWRWVTGEPFEYVAWRSTEPNNGGQGEDSLEVYSSDSWARGGWNDRAAETKGVGYIVEYDLDR